MPMVLEWLAGQGCRRLALVTVPQTTEPEIAAWADAASSRGLALSRPRVLAVPTDAPRWAQHAVQALMDRPAAERPDGLVVTDDNLVPSASAGLLASGVRVPDECRLAAHGNFPWATECFVPAMRFGPDTRQVMRACMDAIDQARRGRPMPDRIVIPVIQDERQAADAVLQEQEGART
jgi:DNA-binding LacI/PurR family transcriptional regulator